MSFIKWLGPADAGQLTQGPQPPAGEAALGDPPLRLEVKKDWQERAEGSLWRHSDLPQVHSHQTTYMRDQQRSHRLGSPSSLTPSLLNPQYCQITGLPSCLNPVPQYWVTKAPHPASGRALSRAVFSFQFIPLPVLYGVFLYMGVASLNGIQVRLSRLVPRAANVPHVVLCH